MAGISAERQETAFIDKVNDAVRKNKNNPITLVAGQTKIFDVIGAEKYKGRQTGGSEPYTDVFLEVLIKGKKEKIIYNSWYGSIPWKIANWLSFSRSMSSCFARMSFTRASVEEARR